jgi:hypothetical protein
MTQSKFPIPSAAAMPLAQHNAPARDESSGAPWAAALAESLPRSNVELAYGCVDWFIYVSDQTPVGGPAAASLKS